MQIYLKQLVGFKKKYNTVMFQIPLEVNFNSTQIFTPIICKCAYLWDMWSKIRNYHVEITGINEKYLQRWHPRYKKMVLQKMLAESGTPDMYKKDKHFWVLQEPNQEEWMNEIKNSGLGKIFRVKYRYCSKEGYKEGNYSWIPITKNSTSTIY